MSGFDLNDFLCLNKKLNSASITTTQRRLFSTLNFKIKIIYSNSIIEENFYIYNTYLIEYIENIIQSLYRFVNSLNIAASLKSILNYKVCYIYSIITFKSNKL